ncbi:GGDEF domain-containing protein [Halopseudomonas sp.]|mgnify:CR=1 FL=1|uniref:GGDEF domain-containing protein n=1 Tax=Halopseudomonas sp. TaxID=2901191 RepID=UPI0039E41E12
MPTTADRYHISTWGGEFTDPTTERAYREHVEQSTAKSLIVALRVWAALVVLFGFLDFLALGFSEGFIHLIGTRVLSACLLLLLAWRLRTKPQLATEGYAVTALEVVGFFLFFLIYIIRPDIVSWNIGVTLIILISLYIFVPNRVVLSNIGAAFGIAGTIYCIALRDVAPTLLVGLTFVLLFPAIIGYAAGLRLQTGQRQQYALFNETVRVNQSLQEEIKRREHLELELKLQATTDPLTGLFNRRQYESLFQRELDRVRRHASALSLCVVDLDHFKKINDEHGHDVGDQVLKHVSRLFVDTLRNTDIVGRFGGEEFILLLPDTDLRCAVQVLNRLRERLHSSLVPVEGLSIQLTATFAVTEVSKQDEGIEDVIRRADRALYDGKKAGRNCVVAS